MFAFLRQVVRGFSVVTLSVLLLPTAVFSCIVGGFIFLPLPANLPEPNSTLPSQASRIYDVNGAEIATVTTFDQNIPVAEGDIPLVLKQALISQEDRNFYKHKGIDLRGSARALWVDLRGGAVQGGSTITQQYVKQAYTNRERTITRKIREAILASQLDRQVSKDEILYRYLSTSYFGSGAYGIGAAAQTYFRKNVKDLTISESAVLVGLIPSPSAWNPRDNIDENEFRRKLVLQSMQKEGYLTPAQFNEEVQKADRAYGSGDGDQPGTNIYAPEQSQSKYPYFTSYVEKYLTLKYGEAVVRGGGLRVQTTLDPVLQKEADDTVSNALKGTSYPLNMALTSVEPQTGFVRAMVGGRDYSQFQVNLALGGCPNKDALLAKANNKVQSQPTCWTTPNVTGGGGGRQPGSSFKPIVLAAAYEEGMSPTKTYNAGLTYSAPSCKIASCVIHNDEGEAFGNITLKEATVHSVNTVYAPLVRDVGFTQTANMAHRLGLDDNYYSTAIQGDNGNYSLGTVEASPLEMASAYGVFANRGVRQSAIPVVKVVDATGKVLEDNSARQGSRVLAENVADNVTDALVGVIQRGTAANTGNIGRPAAGKTGTTSNFGDAWFVGYTPTLSTAVWMGYSNSINTINYKGNTRIYGGTVPTQTWATYMKLALKDVPATEFSEPAPIKAPSTDVLATVGSTAPLPIAPQQTRKPDATSTGDYDRTETAPPPVDAPATTTTAPPVAPGGTIQTVKP